MLRERVQEIAQPRAERAAALRRLEGVDALCASVRGAMEEPSFEVQQQVVQFVVNRMVVEDSRVLIAPIVPTGPVRLPPEHLAPGGPISAGDLGQPPDPSERQRWAGSNYRPGRTSDRWNAVVHGSGHRPPGAKVGDPEGLGHPDRRRLLFQPVHVCAGQRPRPGPLRHVRRSGMRRPTPLAAIRKMRWHIWPRCNGPYQTLTSSPSSRYRGFRTGWGSTRRTRRFGSPTGTETMSRGSTRQSTDS